MASAGRELGNGIEAVQGEEAGVWYETATSTRAIGLGDGTAAGARPEAGRRSETTTNDCRETAGE